MSIKPDTKKIISLSLEELLKNNSIEDITVSDIMSNCNASRSVFYKHFRDKYDLMNWIYINRIEKSRYRDDIREWKNLSLDVYNLLFEKKEYFTHIIKYAQQNNFLEFLYDYSCQYFYDILGNELKVDKLNFEMEVSIKMYSAGTILLVKEWISNGFKESPETISSLACANIPVSLSHYFK